MKLSPDIQKLVDRAARPRARRKPRYGDELELNSEQRYQLSRWMELFEQGRFHDDAGRKVTQPQKALELALQSVRPRYHGPMRHQSFTPALRGLVDEAVTERTQARRSKELLVGEAVTAQGKVLARFDGYSRRSIMHQLDTAVPDCHHKHIHGEWTLDGSYHGPGRGRLIASCEGQLLEINGVRTWHKGWLVE